VRRRDDSCIDLVEEWRNIESESSLEGSARAHQRGEIRDAQWACELTNE
jgi:hypothetical protein